MKRIILIFVLTLISLPNLFAQRALKHRLDSTLNHNFFNGQWNATYKSESTYNAVGECVEFTTYTLDLSTNLLVPDSRYQYEYDGNENIITVSYLNWNSDSNTFEKSSKTDNIFNLSNLITEYSQSLWNEAQNTWEVTFKKTYVYNSNDLLDSYIAIQWDNQNSQWVNYWRANLTYNSNQQLSQFDKQQWEYSTSQWYDTEETVYTYGADTYLDQFIRSISFQPFGPLIQFYKESYTHDSNGNEIEFYSYSWDASSNTWNPSKKSDKAYNSDNDVIEIIQYAAPGFSIPNFKSYITYDNTVSSQDVYTPPLLGKSNTKIIKSESLKWNVGTSSWDSTGINEFFYSDYLTSISENHKIEIQIFPNPATNIISLISDNVGQDFTIDFYDISGKLVLRKSAFGSKNINISELNSGIYIYHIQSGNQKTTGRLIKK